ncbi:hypothetical protein ACFQ7F_37230 [Streptomyces sp. NPDC056486]|uniref:hypothetical protein n=1 Tax=Streptomyces sp. NPDC056486 TaxID=3345835 RepID=UPI003698B0A9
MLRRLLARLLPGTGTRRAYAATEKPPTPRPPNPEPRVQPQPQPRPRLRPRSPYAREVAEDRPIDVSGIPLARPYYRAAERCLLQTERRLALALALEGVDYGPAVIHGVALPA